MALLKNAWFVFAMSQIVWFVCVIGAARELPWVGPVAVAAWIAVHLAVSDFPRQEAMLLGLAGVWGYALDSTLVLLGFFAFAPKARLGSPSTLWMVALWVLFATTLRGPIRRLLDRPVLAALVGAIAGPVAYGGGVRMGAASFGSNPTMSRVAIGIGWAVTLPLLGWLERRLRPHTKLP